MLKKNEYKNKRNGIQVSGIGAIRSFAALIEVNKK